MDAELILNNFSCTYKLLGKGHYGVSGPTLGKDSAAKPGLLQSPGLHGEKRTDSSTLFLDCHMHTMAQASAHRHGHGYTHICKRIFKRQVYVHVQFHNTSCSKDALLKNTGMVAHVSILGE